jgi:hypothetical protein
MGQSKVVNGGEYLAGWVGAELVFFVLGNTANKDRQTGHVNFFVFG